MLLGEGLLLIHVLAMLLRDSRKGSVGDPCSGYVVAGFWEMVCCGSIV